MWEVARGSSSTWNNDDLEEIVMATFKSSLTILPPPQDKFLHPSVQDALPRMKQRTRYAAVLREDFGRRLSQFSAFCRECWRRMRVMNAAFEQAESSSGASSREQSEEQLHDEQAWARMDNEGCPNGHQPEPLQDIVRTDSTRS
jgi:hypothetical protein